MANSFTEIKEALEKWWHNLQFERKCSSTNIIQKTVNDSSLEVQEQVRQIISREIKNIIEMCYKSKDLNDLQCTCNVINGCFDNFIHATDAVRILFSEIVFFIDFGLTECETKLNLRASQKNAVLELLHSFSRILILVLKLKRRQNSGLNKNDDFVIEDLHQVIENNSLNYRSLLSNLTYKIGKLLLLDDILIDTKNNFSISAILIREILVPNKDQLKKFHKNFIESIPVSLSNEICKVNILKFLTCSAIINTWSVDIIDDDSTYIYLRFFISLCEKYSSETAIVLNASRTLVLLIKHECFKIFVNNSSLERVEQTISMLLSCIYMLLEHPVACVRHSARDYLHLLATHPSLHSIMIDSVFKLPTDKRSYFISIGALANEIGSEILIQNNPKLPAQLIAALNDPTIVSHVSLSLEFVILKDSLAVKDFPKWCETYIVPLLISLMNVLPIVAADIEKLLEKAFKKYPNSVVHVIDRWANPTSDKELRYVVTALKISQKQGFKFSKSLIQRNQETTKNENHLDTEKDLMSERLLECCLHHRDDDIRISAFSLLIEAHKSTKPYLERDFRLILYGLKYNLNNQQPATRQKMLGLIRKMLVRFSESKVTFLKPAKNKVDEENKAAALLMYDKFLDSLVEFCFSNIFVGCNFSRLNTVLNILLLCFDNVRDMSFNSDKTNFYWSKFLIALDSSYEENKELVVMLIKNLNLSLLNVNNVKSAKLLYDKAFLLCTHMEPPDVLTGSYLLQVLMKLPSSREVLSTYFVDDYKFDDVCYCCIQVLMLKLKEQLQLAKLDLMTAATCGPMYGALSAIRLIFKNVDFSVQEESALREWSKILKELVDMCFDMTRIVGCVVNSSSPEGHLPMDFQTDFENMLSIDFNEKEQKNGSKDLISPSGRDKTVQLIQIICTNLFKKFSKLETVIENPECDTYESLRSLKALLKENQLLIHKIKALNDNHELSLEENPKDYKLLVALKSVKSKIEFHLERLKKMNFIIEWPATAQVLLLCAWRTIKEASLYVGDILTKLPLETQIKLGLLTQSTIIRIGEELKTLLCEIKHRGAFEHVYLGFMQLVNSLWKCSDKNLSILPKQWLEDIINQLELPLNNQKLKLCSTRRSAGLPFLVQAIICSEVVSVKSTTPSSLHFTMKSLFKILGNDALQNPDAKIHALNVLRALFKHAQLGEHVASYVSKALMFAIRGSRATSWSERNSSNLLFSSLMIRIFGVSRCRDEISKKNRMTSRTFFQRYSELYDFMLSEMDLVYSKKDYIDGLYPKPSLYLLLLILGRLYPPPAEDPENIDLSEFLPYINLSRRNPIMKIRQLGARALVSLISFDRLLDELDDRFAVLFLRNGTSDNEKHGILLQIMELILQSQEAFAFENLTYENSRKLYTWVETTKWMLESTKRMSLVMLSAYVKVLHIFYKKFIFLREMISEIVAYAPVSKYLLNLSPEKQSLFPGIYLFLENFHFLKIDILACEFLYTDDVRTSGNFFELFFFMLMCEVNEVQSIPLRILCCVLRENAKNSINFDDDDGLSGIGAPLADLLFLQLCKNVKKLQVKLLIRSLISLLTDRLNKNEFEFKSTVIHRMWLMVVSSLVMNNVISFSNSTILPSDYSLKIDFAKTLIKSRDKDLSTSALICYAIYLMEVSMTERVQTPSEDRIVLADILDEFSSSIADVKERLAVARIINRFSDYFTEKRMISDPIVFKIWMIPFKLIADEDSGVRMASSELVYKLQGYIIKEIPLENLLIKMKTLDWPHLPLVSLRAQECLLDSYINILGYDNLLYLVVQIFINALSSFGDLPDFESHSKDEFGVFEKGNPNPYCEDLALSDLMCLKLAQLNSITDLETVMRSDLDNSLSEFISESLQVPDLISHSLMEVVEAVTNFVKGTEKLKGEFSLPLIQIRNLRKALGLQEVV